MSAEPPPLDPARADESNLGWILGVNIAFHVLALVFVALRVYTRLFIVKTFGKDDFLLLIATSCVLGGGMVTYIIAAQHGLGRHRQIIPKEDYKTYLKMTFIQALVSTIGGLGFLKISIGLSLIRLSQQKWYTRVVWGFIGFVVVYSVVSYVEWFLVCKPLAGFWDKDLLPVCLPITTHKAFALLNTSCNLFTDIAFATLPIPVIWVLQMAKKTRIYLIGILSLGYFAVMVGIVKAVCQNVFRGQYDQSFYNWIQFWGFLQINIGIIAACAPVLRPLFAGALQLSSNRGSRYPSNSKNNKYSSNNRASKLTGLSGSRTEGKGWVKTNSQVEGFELDEHFRRHDLTEQQPTEIGIAISVAGSEEIIKY